MRRSTPLGMGCVAVFEYDGAKREKLLCNRNGSYLRTGRRLDVPIIMITAYGGAETKRKALENGAEALRTKPINFGTLRSEIDMRVERAA